jgi:hypothetical protein
LNPLKPGLVSIHNASVIYFDWITEKEKRKKRKEKKKTDENTKQKHRIIQIL